MCHEVLVRLREDHERFEGFFQAIAKKCNQAEGGRSINHLRLKAIAAYIGQFALPPHHALEEAIFAQLTRVFPRFQEDIYDLIEDHQISKREFQIFARALETEGHEFVEPARSFVANERGHFIAEEEIVFSHAAQYLRPDQWPSVGEFLPKVDTLPAGIDLIRDLIS